MTAATNPEIAALEPGQDVTGTWACTRKSRLSARNGAPFLHVELRDATGRIAGRAFRDVAYLDGRFEQGDVVRVTARVEDYRGQRQLTIRAIERVTTDESAALGLLPRAYRDLDELEGFLEHLAREVHDPGLRQLLVVALADDELRRQLRTAPCTRSGHHAYLGGLLEHTVAVTMLAQATCELHRKLDSDLLLAAAILHDVGKTREFDYGAEITLSQAGQMLGHLQLGAELIREIAQRAPQLAPDRLMQLLNCVLSHHGPLDGRRFASAEALALQRINTLDAQVKESLEHGALAGSASVRVARGPGGESAARHTPSHIEA
jgi:3'-5' exoribonuclease